MENYTGEGPKWRLEHATSNQATCQQASCKREKVKFEKGELRIGTHTFFDLENRWYMAWRHWGCGTKHQIRGLIEVTENDPTKAPGYDRLSPEAQEQVRLAFENEGIPDKSFKGIRKDLAGFSKRYDGEITNAESYRVDVAKVSRAGCRKSDCPDNGVKIQKGELRLAICVPFDGEHSSWVYKHWKCISKFDLEKLKERHGDELLDGLDELPEDYKKVVIDTIDSGEVVEPPKLETEPSKKTSRKRKKDDEDDLAVETPKSKRKAAKKDDKKDDIVDAPKPKRKARKAAAAKDSDEESEPEYVPRKSKRRAAAMIEEAM